MLPFQRVREKDLGFAIPYDSQPPNCAFEPGWLDGLGVRTAGREGKKGDNAARQLGNAPECRHATGSPTEHIC